MKRETKNNDFHKNLKQKLDEFAYLIYKVTKIFPRDEIYGITSQIRRASLSVVLNYIEGYARSGDKQLKNFLQMSYGSLKETKYLLFFSEREAYITKNDYTKLINLSEEIGAMLWTTIKGIEDKLK
ncbi:MAG: four helix bundle protein [Candidatus Moranbacteria bacterium CG10_big_fil_rev_8_21_14_0_10_35_21]|nr:MAG: four helix bundle protein [Candidatus Moranbacteria bacterium CG10_big_fil_rev_8_21_14_0_10_35_21]PJA88256.1 MAG: four helix bundle protein [Candidatus Moranbacteria bacterium CG_4_9_14_3_um_filter_36_9]